MVSFPAASHTEKMQKKHGCAFPAELWEYLSRVFWGSCSGIWRNMVWMWARRRRALKRKRSRTFLEGRLNWWTKFRHKISFRHHSNSNNKTWCGRCFFLACILIQWWVRLLRGNWKTFWRWKTLYMYFLFSKWLLGIAGNKVFLVQVNVGFLLGCHPTFNNFPQLWHPEQPSVILKWLRCWFSSKSQDGYKKCLLFLLKKGEASWKTNYILSFLARVFLLKNFSFQWGAVKLRRGGQLLQEDEQKRSRHVTWLHQVVCVCV